ncbi:DDE-type integrase/transposase/recombinase [Pelagibius litoralis]|nr:DDE-type integrase/transposase/recombinase [Pelagibius litoralis]
MMYIRYPLSLWQVEDLLFERGIDICHETVRFWWNRFGPMFASAIRKYRDRKVALNFLKRAMKRYGQPRSIVTDLLRSYRAAMKVIGNSADQICGRWLHSRAENSHQPFRRREGAMAKFRDIKTLQKFASVHASIHNHFNLDRHLNRRDIFKQNRSAALAEWHQMVA